jgi:hypothetical protein
MCKTPVERTVLTRMPQASGTKLLSPAGDGGSSCSLLLHEALPAPQESGGVLQRGNRSQRPAILVPSLTTTHSMYS